MTVAFAEANMQANQGEGQKPAEHTIPPAIKALFRDLSEIRRVALVQSPEILPLLAPSLIEAEIHVRQIWANQF